MKSFTRLLSQEHHLDRLFAELATIIENNSITVKVSDVTSSRSLSQNKLMWMWISAIKKHFLEHFGKTYVDDAIHEYLKSLFLEPIVYKFKDSTLKKYSSKSLSTKEFTAYLEKIDMYCADTLNLILPHPEDIFNEAMGRK